jgi:hypothetical protein
MMKCKEASRTRDERKPGFPIRNGAVTMSPTVFKEKGFRFFFFSREETRMHVHVHGAEGEAKFWLEPELKLDRNFGLSSGQLKQIEEIIKDHYDDLVRAWQKHFGN